MYGIVVDRRSPLSATRQLCDALRERVHAGSLRPGERLPSSREAAAELGLSRTVTLEAYEQLGAEGYLEGRPGSGTYVAAALKVGAASDGKRVLPRARRDDKASAGRPVDCIDFDRAAGTPDLSGFPLAEWNACLRGAGREVSPAALWYGDPAGEAPLRKAICGYLFRAKGLAPDPGNVFITCGARDGILQSLMFLAPRLSCVVVEDPTLPSIYSLAQRTRLPLADAAVDDEGIVVETLRRAARPHGARVILVTPAHHYPTGAILCARRRLDLTALARARGDIVIEDDYDSEFRYRGVPVPPLASLAPEITIHAGTFSKTLFPGIRLGYLVMPAPLAADFARFRRSVISWPPVIDQRALARFIESGRFERHVHKMRRRYAARAAVLRAAISRELGSAAQVRGAEAGLHLRLDLSKQKGREPNWDAAAKFAVTVTPVASRRGSRYRRSVALGFGNLSEERIREGVRRLAAFLSRT